MQKQVSNYIEKYLSRYLYGYRKGLLLIMLFLIENRKESLDKKGYAVGILF